MRKMHAESLADLVRMAARASAVRGRTLGAVPADQTSSPEREHKGLCARIEELDRNCRSTIGPDCRISWYSRWSADAAGALVIDVDAVRRARAASIVQRPETGLVRPALSGPWRDRGRGRGSDS